MKKAKWIADLKFTTRKEFEKTCKEQSLDPKDYDIHEYSEIEISVVREDNKRGQESYGWGDDDKIILFDGSDHEEVTREDMDWYQKVAETICKALNHEGL